MEGLLIFLPSAKHSLHEHPIIPFKTYDGKKIVAVNFLLVNSMLVTSLMSLEIISCLSCVMEAH